MILANLKKNSEFLLLTFSQILLTFSQILLTFFNTFDLLAILLTFSKSVYTLVYNFNICFDLLHLLLTFWSYFWLITIYFWPYFWPSKDVCRSFLKNLNFMQVPGVHALEGSIANWNESKQQLVVPSTGLYGWRCRIWFCATKLQPKAFSLLCSAFSWFGSRAFLRNQTTIRYFTFARRGDFIF